MKLLLLLFCAYRGAWSYQTEPTIESITAAGGKVEELVTAEPLNAEQINKGIVEVDAKPKTKESIVKKGPALFKELADAKILPIAVGEPNGKATVTASGSVEEVLTSNLNLEQILKGIVEVDAKPKTKESEAKKRPNLFKELAEKYARYFTKDRKKRPDVQILPMPIAVGEPNGQKPVDFSLDGYFYQGDKKIATYRIDFHGVHFSQGALRAERPSELVDPRPTKGGEKNNGGETDELVNPRPEKPVENKDNDEELVDPRPEKPVENKDNDKELVDPRPEKPVENKDNDKELVDPIPEKPAPSKDNDKELVDPLPPKGDKKDSELVDPRLREDVDCDSPPRVRNYTKEEREAMEKAQLEEINKGVTIEEAGTDASGKTTEAQKQVTEEPTATVFVDPTGTIASADTTTTVQKLITTEVDPAGTTEAQKHTKHNDATIEVEGTTTTVEKLITPEVHGETLPTGGDIDISKLTASPVPTKENSETTTGAGPIAPEGVQSTAAVKEVENEGDPTPTPRDTTPEVDPVPTNAKPETTADDVTIDAAKSTAHVEVTATPQDGEEAGAHSTGAATIAVEKSTAAVEVTATPVEEKEAVVSTTGAGPIDAGVQKSTAAATPNVEQEEHASTGAPTDSGIKKTTAAAKEEEGVVSTTGSGPIDSDVQKSTEAAKEEAVVSTTGAGPIDSGVQKSTEAAPAAATTQGKEDVPSPTGDGPVYTGVPPKYEFGNGKCTTMYEFYFDDTAKRCLAKRFWVCNETDWKQVSQEKTFAACMKTAPKIMPADGNDQPKCGFGKVWSRVPGEPSAYLYFKVCEDHSCPNEGTCVQSHKTAAHCCIFPTHQNNMK